MKTDFFTTLLVSALATVALGPPASGLEERPRAVLYIAAEPGCYSATYISARTIPAKAPKKLYPVSCSEKHHYEVYWAGKMKTQPGNPIPASKASLNHCLEKEKNLVILGRGANAYNFSPDEMTGTGNWLADKGPEAKRYPKRVVCYIGLSTKDFRYFKEMSQPLIKGLE